MVEISNNLWESLYILKEMYDHDEDSPVLKWYRDSTLDGDNMYEIAVNATGAVFQDTRNYYNEDREYDTYVFFDPVITEFWTLCETYEARAGLRKEDNPYRHEMLQAIDSALYIPDYSCGTYSYEDTKRKNGCRLVLVLGIEFGSHYMVPGALCEAYEAFEIMTKRVRRALEELDEQKVVAFPAPQEERRAA